MAKADNTIESKVRQMDGTMKLTFKDGTSKNLTYAEAENFKEGNKYDVGAKAETAKPTATKAKVEAKPTAKEVASTEAKAKEATKVVSKTDVKASTDKK